MAADKNKGGGLGASRGGKDKLNPWKIQGYKPGQNVICKIMRAEPGGYSVLVVKDNLPGYLPSNAHHNSGEEILAQFVCIDKNRMLLSERFTAGSGKVPMGRQASINWEEQLDQIDDQYSTGNQEIAYEEQPADQYQPYQMDQYVPHVDQQYQDGTQESPFAPPPPGQQYATGAQPAQQYQTGSMPQQQQSGAQAQQQWDTAQQSPQQQWDSGGAQSAQQWNSGGQAQQQQWETQPQQQQQQYQTGAMPPQQQQQYQTGAMQAQQYQTGAMPPQQPPQQQQQQYQTGAQPAPQQWQTGAQQAQQYQSGQQPQQPQGDAQFRSAPQPPQQYQSGPQAQQQPPQQQFQSGQQQQQYQSGGHPQQFATGPLPAQYQTGAMPAQQPQQQSLTGPMPAQYNQSGGAPPAQFQPAPPQQQQFPQGMTDEEKAFAVYARNVPARKFQLRRAIDLIMPPMDNNITSLRIGDYDVEWLITDLEGGMRTGCVKAACESRLSRAAMLLYKGRAVGCIYGCKSDPNTRPTEESLNVMLSDLESPDTMVQIYDLPEDVTLAMSSLFLGYPVERNDDYSSREYMDYICDWFGKEGGTATLAITLGNSKGTCLGYVYKGQFTGAFYVEDQTFSADREFVYNILERDPQASLEVSILPPEMHSNAVRFGFSLSMARSRNAAKQSGSPAL